jgi:hypothetical protein
MLNPLIQAKTMNKISLFQQFTQIVADVSLSEVLHQIKNGKYKTEVEQVRYVLKSAGKEESDKVKKTLPAFTVSGVFEGGRSVKHLKQYSKYIILDIDKLSEKEIEETRLMAQIAEYTLATFISPSGNGLKIIVEVDSDADKHMEAFLQVADYYEKALNVEIDPSGKDIPRLCFFSYDPECYVKDKHLVFKVKDTVKAETKVEKKEPNTKWLDAFQKCVAFTENKTSFEENNRNNFVYLLASNLNRTGVPFTVALELITANYKLDLKEAEASIRSAYNNHSSEHNTKQPPAVSDEDYLLKSQLIPDAVFENLPEILKKGVSGFTDVRERDVFFTGALSILSGCLPNVRGVYAQRTVYPNLFSFIIAPAASGKGALLSAKNLGDALHDMLLKNSNEEQLKYASEMEKYKQAQRSKKKSEEAPAEQPAQPPFVVIFIPANASNAKVLWHLQQNGGSGIICETEADTMGQVFKQEWGGYSDMLRKAFHHEKISCSRKTNNEFIEVKEPRLAIALSGTPSQVSNLIASAEDGLFSRFIFYCFKTELLWRDVSPSAGGINLTELFQELALQVVDIHNMLSQYPTEVQLTDEQWNILNQKFQKWLTEVSVFTGDEAASIVKRLGLILFRFCMLFTALRKVENGDTAKQIVCTDNDFANALSLVNTYLSHSILMYNNLPKKEEGGAFKKDDIKQRFYEALPQKFKREEAIKLGEKFSLKPRTIDGMLKKLQPQYLISAEYGTYQKV